LNQSLTPLQLLQLLLQQQQLKQQPLKQQQQKQLLLLLLLLPRQQRQRNNGYCSSNVNSSEACAQGRGLLLRPKLLWRSLTEEGTGQLR